MPVDALPLGFPTRIDIGANRSCRRAFGVHTAEPPWSDATIIDAGITAVAMVTESEAPALPNGAKRKAMKRRQQEKKRHALYRLVGVDLTRIDGVETETAEVVISEYGFSNAALIV